MYRQERKINEGLQLGHGGGAKRSFLEAGLVRFDVGMEASLICIIFNNSGCTIGSGNRVRAGNLARGILRFFSRLHTILGHRLEAEREGLRVLGHFWLILYSSWRSLNLEVRNHLWGWLTLPVVWFWILELDLELRMSHCVADGHLFVSNIVALVAKGYQSQEYEILMYKRKHRQND